MNHKQEPKKSLVDSHLTASNFSDITSLFRAKIP